MGRIKIGNELLVRREQWPIFWNEDCHDPFFSLPRETILSADAAKLHRFSLFPAAQSACQNVYTDFRGLNLGPDVIFFSFGVVDKAEISRLNALERKELGTPAAIPNDTRDMPELLVICTRLSRGSAPTHDARTLCALDAKGGGRSPAIIRRLSAKKFLGTATSVGWKATWWAWLTIFALISVDSS